MNYEKVIHQKVELCEQLFEIAECLINKGVQRFLKGKKEKLTENSPRGERKKHFVKCRFYEMFWAKNMENVGKACFSILRLYF